MTITEAAAILKQHNVWRRWQGVCDEEAPEPASPSDIGIAIDLVVAHIEAIPEPPK